MLKVYGYSDDNVVIEGAPYPFDEIGCFDEIVTVWFTDGTVIEVGYGKEDKGIWWIKIREEGSSESTLTECNDEDSDIYSDIFEIDSEVEDVCVGDVVEDVQDIKKVFREIKKEYPLNYIQMAYEEIFND